MPVARGRRGAWPYQ